MSLVQAKPFRLALIQLGHTGPDKSSNIALARKFVQEASASARKPDLIVLPEIWNSPYAVTSFREYSEKVPEVGSTGEDGEGETVKALRGMARDMKAWLIGGSIPEREEKTDSIYNTCTVYDPQGKMVAKHRKVHLFDIDIKGKQVFKESESLTAGESLTIFEAPFGKIGLGICYDVRFPEMAMIAARQGCVAMVYPGAFNTTTGPMHWSLLARARAVDNQIYVAMCSPARNPDATYQAYGHSMLVNPRAEILVEASETPDIVYGDVDPDFLNELRGMIPITTQRRFGVYPDVSACAKS